MAKRTDEEAASCEAEKQTYLAERYATFERDGFKCTICGRGVKESAILDVEEEKGALKTVCTDCKEGKEFMRRTE